MFLRTSKTYQFRLKGTIDMTNLENLSFVKISDQQIRHRQINPEKYQREGNNEMMKKTTKKKRGKRRSAFRSSSPMKSGESFGDDVYFCNYVHMNEEYYDPHQIERYEDHLRKEQAMDLKMYNKNPFRYSAATCGSSSALHRPIKYFSPAKNKPRTRPIPRNIYTSPPKRGGYGVIGTTIGEKPYGKWVKNPYVTYEDILRKEKVEKREKMTNDRPFTSASKTRALFDGHLVCDSSSRLFSFFDDSFVFNTSSSSSRRKKKNRYFTTTLPSRKSTTTTTPYESKKKKKKKKNQKRKKKKKMKRRRRRRRRKKKKKDSSKEEEDEENGLDFVGTIYQTSYHHRNKETRIRERKEMEKMREIMKMKEKHQNQREEMIRKKEKEKEDYLKKKKMMKKKKFTRGKIQVRPMRNTIMSHSLPPTIKNDDDYRFILEFKKKKYGTSSGQHQFFFGEKNNRVKEPFLTVSKPIHMFSSFEHLSANRRFGRGPNMDKKEMKEEEKWMKKIGKLRKIYDVRFKKLYKRPEYSDNYRGRRLKKKKKEEEEKEKRRERERLMNE